jgi:hypothetical protein
VLHQALVSRQLQHLVDLQLAQALNVHWAAQLVCLVVEVRIIGLDGLCLFILEILLKVRCLNILH